MVDPRLTRISAGVLATGLLLATLLRAANSQQDVTEISVPSGQPLTLYESRIVAPENKILYLAFLAEALGGEYGVTFDRASLDMDKVCAEIGIPMAGKLIGDGTRIDEIVVRLMERPIEYGAVDETAAQFLNAYDISGGTCEWF